jgi:hypothetical protein
VGSSDEEWDGRAVSCSAVLPPHEERKTESISGSVYAYDIQISFIRSGSEENL